MCRSLYRLTDEILDLPEGGKRIPPPWCASCGGRVRPGVVWFGEALPKHAWQAATAAARDCDAFLVIGTSAIVQPAGSLVHVARDAGALAVQINPNSTGVGEGVLFSLQGTAGQILPGLMAQTWSRG